MKPRRILVTGATGFVGKHLVAALLSNGERLTLAVRNAEACPHSWLGREDIRIVETGSIENSQKLDDAFADVSRVVHAAGLAHVKAPGDVDGKDAFVAANAEATRLLVDKASATGVTTFVHVSSIAAVADNTSSSIIDDGTEEVPVTPYGRSKRIAEDHVASLAKKGLFAVSLRPPLVFGAEARGNWGALRRLAMTGVPLPFASVRNRRSLMDVDELARAISLLCSREWPARASGNYCIASEQTISLAEIVTDLRAGMGMPARVVPCPPSFLYALARIAGRQRAVAGLLGDLIVDARRFRETFGFSETLELRAAIRGSERHGRHDEALAPQ